MDIAHILTEYGAYYLRSGQNTKRVIQLLLQGAVTTSYMTPAKTDDTVFQMSNSSLEDIVQGFQPDYTPMGNLKFIPNEIRLRQFKVDFDEQPDILEATWLGFLVSDAVARKDWPFVRWLIEQHIIPKIHQQMEMQVYGKGVYSPPKKGVPHPAKSSMDGLNKIIKDGVNSDGKKMGVINSVPNIGPLEKATIFDQVEGFVDGISEVYQNVPMNVYLSPTYRKAFLRDKRSKGFFNISKSSEIDDSIDFTPQQLVGLPSMAGETYMFATPKSNMFHVTKKSANKTKFKIEESKRTVSILSDWWEAIGFGINEAVWTTIEKTN